MPLRYDTGKIIENRKDFGFTEEGFLQVTAIVTRTGVFNYRNADGSLRRELRHPNDVFLSDSLNSMRLIPITNDHPSELVNMDNVKKHSIGNCGEIVTVDGKFIKISMTIQDRAGIDAVLNGRDELSLGYQVVAVDEAGEYNGMAYDVRQTQIRYNHLAIVDIARAGSEAKIKLDADDACITDEEIKGNSHKTFTKTKEKKMPVVKLDGIEYEAAQEVINHSAKLDSRIAELVTALDSVKAELAKIEAERDDAKEKLQKAEDQLKPEAIKARVDARVAFETKARKILGTEFKLDGLDEKSIKIETLKKSNPELNLDGKSQDYIDARFDIAIESIKEDTGNTDSTERQLHSLNGSVNLDSRETTDAGTARSKMIENMKKRSSGVKEKE